MYDKRYVIFYNKDLTEDEAFEHKNVLADEMGEVFGRYQHISYDNYIGCLEVIDVDTSLWHNEVTLKSTIMPCKQCCQSDNTAFYEEINELKRQLRIANFGK